MSQYDGASKTCKSQMAIFTSNIYNLFLFSFWFKFLYRFYSQLYICNNFDLKLPKAFVKSLFLDTKKLLILSRLFSRDTWWLLKFGRRFTSFCLTVLVHLHNIYVYMGNPYCFASTPNEMERKVECFQPDKVPFSLSHQSILKTFSPDFRMNSSDPQDEMMRPSASIFLTFSTKCTTNNVYIV